MKDIIIALLLDRCPFFVMMAPHGILGGFPQYSNKSHRIGRLRECFNAHGCQGLIEKLSIGAL